MTTTDIIWIAVIAVAALVVIGLIVGLMRKKSHASKHARAEELRHEATTEAAGLPDVRARAEQAEAQAQAKRIEAERAEKDAALARTDLDQQQAAQEDRIRAADRLDPHVDHKAKDYSPEVATPAGPANVPSGTASAEPQATSPAASTATGTSAGTSAELPDESHEPTDTSPRDTTVATDGDTLRSRLEGTPGDTEAGPGTTGGSHRA